MKGLTLYETRKMSESEWQAFRLSLVTSGRIGGSDIGVLLGLNKWKSPINLFYQAIGVNILPDKMNIEMLMGKLQEDNIGESWQYWDEDNDKFIQNYMTRTKVRRYKKIRAIIVNPTLPHLFANVDGLITKCPERKGKGILELKKINGMTIDQYESGIPPHYEAQVQHYMLVTGKKYGQLCMRVDGNKLAVKVIDADPEYQANILAAAEDHHNRVMACRDAIKPGMSQEEVFQIATQYEPPVDGSDAYSYFISEKHKLRALENSMVAPELGGKVEDYLMYKEAEKGAEERKQGVSNGIKKFMEDNGVTKLDTGDHFVTWRKQFNVTKKK